MVAALLLAGVLSVLRMAPAMAENHTVTMVGTAFVPPTVSIATGDSVTWDNKEAANYPGVLGVHNIVFDKGGEPASPPINPGESWVHVFNKPGTFAYHCGIHPTQMKGTIDVSGAPKAASSSSTTVAAPAPAPKAQQGGGAAKTRRIELTVEEKEMPLFGVPETWWTYNGTVPGTTIRANVGDTLEIVLHNTNNVPHAIHTHFEEYPISSDGSSMTAPLPVVPHQEDDVVGAAGGIVPGAAQTPGPAVGQNPIGPYDPRGDRDVAGPGQTYTYRYKMTEAGTSWYHCHVFEATDHISKGLYGLIIVYPQGWKWEELPPDPRNGNTKAWVTTETGERLFEDLVIIGERSVNVGPAAPTDSTIGLAAQGGIAGGPLNVANGRGWNDPYVVGPVRSGQKVLLHVADIGESVHSWHVHAHHFMRLQQFDREGDHQPGWFTKPLENMHNMSIGPGDIFPTLLTAGKPGYWFEHDHVVPSAYLGMVPWLHILPGESKTAPAAAAGQASVSMVEPSDSDPNSWRFEPAEVTVAPGGKVSWKNDGKQDHDVTADEGSPAQFSSGNIKPGASWEQAFDKPGDYRYHCSLHPWMTGVVTVGEPASTTKEEAAGGGSRGPQESSGASASAAPASAAPAATRAPSSSASVSAAPAAPTSVDVNLVEGSASDAKSWRFDPADVTVGQGGTVTWHNTGAQPHNVVSTADPQAFSSDTLKTGDQFLRRFDIPGTYEYTCTFHPWMKGKVTVVAAGAANAGAPTVLTPANISTPGGDAPAAGANTTDGGSQSVALAAQSGDGGGGGGLWVLPFGAIVGLAIGGVLVALTKWRFLFR